MRLFCIAMVLAILVGAAGSLAMAESVTPTAAQLEAMQPAMDSVLRAMFESEDGKYAPDDPDFVWSVLYMMGENFPASHPEIREDEDGLVVVPVAAQLAFLHAAFAGLEELPLMPEYMEAMVRFDPIALEFTLLGSDAGETVSKLGDFAVNDDGSVSATLNLIDPDGAVVVQTQFTLVANADAEPFPYRIQAAE